jgi:hypothetical protein
MKNFTAGILLLLFPIENIYSLGSRKKSNSGDGIKIYAMQLNSLGFHIKNHGYFQASKPPFRYSFGLTAGLKINSFNFGPYWQISPTGFAQKYRIISDGSDAILARESFHVRTTGLTIELNPPGFLLGVRLGSLKSIKATYLGSSSEVFGTYTYNRTLMVNPYIGFEISLDEASISEESLFRLRFSADFQFYNLKNREIDGILFEERASNKKVIQQNLFCGLNISIIKLFDIE